MNGQGKLDRHIIFESMLMLCAKNCYNQSMHVETTGCLIWRMCFSETQGSVEIVDKFCYLGDMLSVDGDGDAAMTARIHNGWFKLVPHCQRCFLVLHKRL